MLVDGLMTDATHKEMLPEESGTSEVSNSCGTNRNVGGDLIVGVCLFLLLLITVLEEHVLVHGVRALELAKRLKER